MIQRWMQCAGFCFLMSACGCATWAPVQDLPSMSYGELGSVRLVLEDSSRVTLDEAFLIDSNITGRGDQGSVLIPVSRVSSVERREVQGFEIFFVANAASLAFLILATHPEYWAPGVLR